MNDEMHAFIKIRLREMQQSVMDSGRQPQIMYDLIILFQAIDRLLEENRRGNKAA